MVDTDKIEVELSEVRLPLFFVIEALKQSTTLTTYDIVTAMHLARKNYEQDATVKKMTEAVIPFKGKYLGRRIADVATEDRQHLINTRKWIMSTFGDDGGIKSDTLNAINFHLA